MTPDIVIHECRRRGIVLRLDGGQIRVRGDGAAITPGVMAAIKANRGEIMAMLADESRSDFGGETADLVRFSPGEKYAPDETVLDLPPTEMGVTPCNGTGIGRERERESTSSTVSTVSVSILQPRDRAEINPLKSPRKFGIIPDLHPEPLIAPKTVLDVLGVPKSRSGIEVDTPDPGRQAAAIEAVSGGDGDADERGLGHLPRLLDRPDWIRPAPTRPSAPSRPAAPATPTALIFAEALLRHAAGHGVELAIVEGSLRATAPADLPADLWAGIAWGLADLDAEVVAILGRAERCEPNPELARKSPAADPARPSSFTAEDCPAFALDPAGDHLTAPWQSAAELVASSPVPTLPLPGATSARGRARDEDCPLLGRGAVA